MTRAVVRERASGGARDCSSGATSDISIRHRVMDQSGPGGYGKTTAVSEAVCFSCEGYIT